MVYACRLAQEQGIDALVKDIKRRGVLKADIVYKDTQVQEFWDQLSKNIYTNMITAVLWVLYDKYGFRKERLNKFKKAYDEAVKITLDLDYMGEHYVTLEDYAVELNSKYNMGIDVNHVALCEEMCDKKDPNYREYKHINGVIAALMAAGYTDAAAYLESKKVK